MTGTGGGDAERARWNARYAAIDAGGHTSAPAPSAWVVERGLRLPPGAVIVDLACGTGRHARALAAGGRRVIAVDFVERAVGLACSGEPLINGVVADATALPFRQGTLDAIVCVSFLDRALFPKLVGSLRRGGCLIYETFTVAHGTMVSAGRAHGPTNPAYLLAPGELLALVAPLDVLEHSEALLLDDAGPRHVARVVAVRRD